MSKNRPQQLKERPGGMIVGPGNEPFNLGSVCLALVKTYARKHYCSVEREARGIAEANGLDYFLILEDKHAGLMRVKFGHPGNYEPERVLGTKSIDLYTVNFYGIPRFGGDGQEGKGK